jgi:diaminohydroxyphosphoribosylaminopyrimidine deaminase/5-amino-6-(5-phosphoribosylamino)uracil reductase
MSLDGRTALGNGVSQWITGAEARADGHHLRARSCAMLTGAGTVRQDDPALTVRHVKTNRQPLRIVVDNKCEAPAKSQVFNGGHALLVTVTADAPRIQEYEARGVEVLVMAPGKSGRVDFKALLQLLGARGFNEITVEAGSRLNGALLEAGVIDEWVIYVAPTLLGEGAAGVVQGTPLTALAQRSDLTIMSVMSFGNDLRIVARSI